MCNRKLQNNAQHFINCSAKMGRFSRYTLTSSVIRLQKPLSACCDIPELGNPKTLSKCTPSHGSGPCNDVQCAFDKSGFLSDPQTLNRQAYKSHLRKWAEEHPDWSSAVDKAIADCVDKDLRQYLDVPCKAYDVFACTGIAMLKSRAIRTQHPPYFYFKFKLWFSEQAFFNFRIFTAVSDRVVAVLTPPSAPSFGVELTLL
ncbi:hypothetical protein EVAR_11541_1 [Eumeta japonica]|uniref:Uncharacterized protein n=1 Tax=Eumeta variegata TaxID=151549 RepID=A0A4C1TZ62_EUMVA|nr:hypothetical protein EVAR_11541_1 [Eumeta japonica]